MATVLPPAPYYIILARVERRPYIDVWPIQLAALAGGTCAIVCARPGWAAHLRAIVLAGYDRGGYVLRIDYRQPVPLPPLEAEQQAWIAHLLATHWQQAFATVRGIPTELRSSTVGRSSDMVLDHVFLRRVVPLCYLSNSSSRALAPRYTSWRPETTDSMHGAKLLENWTNIFLSGQNGKRINGSRLTAAKSVWRAC